MNKMEPDLIRRRAPTRARRAEERGRTPRRTRRLQRPFAEGQGPRGPEGNARGGGERAHRERVHPQAAPAARQPPPAQAAPRRVSGGAVAEAGAAIPRATGMWYVKPLP